MQRLEKIISEHTNYTRKDIKNLILQKQVLVNGKVANLGLKCAPNDQISIKNEILNQTKHYYIMLNKPSGYLSANYDKNDKTVFELIGNEIPKKNLTIWGRLDKDTEGLIILSTNGELGHKLLSPKNHVPKTYYVQTDRILNNSIIQEFEKGVLIDLNHLAKGTVSNLDKNTCKLTIFEGKFHQVKKMFKSLNYEVTYLKRLTFGNLQLDDSLRIGDYRLLTNEEIQQLENE